MNTDKKFTEFKSVEEIKEFIEQVGIEEALGVFCFVDKDGNIMDTANFANLVNMFGIDSIAKAIFNTINDKKIHTISKTKEEIRDILKRFEENPDTLSKDERIIAQSIIKENAKLLYNETCTFFDSLLYVFSIFEEKLINNYNTFLCLLNTLVESTLCESSDKIRKLTENMSIYQEVSKNIAEQIIIPNNIDDELLLLGLTRFISDHFNSDKNKLCFNVNFKETAKVLCPDFEFGESSNDDTEETPVSNEVNLDIRKKMKDNM